MTTEHWDRVEQLLEEVRDVPPGDREAFLHEVCDDGAVRNEVASLVKVSDEASDYFDRLAEAIPSAVQELQGREAPKEDTGDDPLDLEGDQIGRYAVETHLGGGGMGVVYRARDTQLDRPVALKFLPPSLAVHSEADERFVREAKATAALDHSHIATIYEIGETEAGQRFIAMAYYDGETLKEKLDREGLLPLEEALEYAIQIAEGLARAHEAGIIHRDVKPANIMVTETGQVKLLDFGLARVMDRSRLTEPGRRMGTAAYMSPEQAEGETVGARTDLWAWGIVCYEMITGKRPFQGEREAALLHAVLHEEPTPPSALRPEISQKLEAVLLKALKKDREKRYQSTNELLDALKQVPEAEQRRAPSNRSAASSALWNRRAAIGLAGLAVVLMTLWAIWPEDGGNGGNGGDWDPKARRGMVVLPCSDEAGDRALCTGLMESLTDQLIRLQRQFGVWVVPADEVRRRGVATPRRAQQVYNTDLILTGMAARQEGRVRLRLTLLDGAKLEEKATVKLNPPVANLTTLQNGATAGVAEMLNTELPSQESAGAARLGTASPQAYEAYLQGRGHLWRHSEANHLDAAIDALRQSVSTDTVYARAHAGLCEGYWHRFQATQDTKWVTAAEQHCKRAVSLNDQLAAAHKNRGVILTGTGKRAASVQAFQRACSLRPERPDLYRHLASALEANGQSNQAESTYQSIVYRWPNYWVGYDELGKFNLRQGRFEAAATQFREAVNAAPQNAKLYNNLAASYLYLGDLTEAQKVFENLIDEYPNFGAYSNLGTIYFQDGRYADAAQMYEKALDLRSNDYRLWGNLASAHYWAGARDEAQTYYERAVQIAEKQRKAHPQQPLLIAHLGGFYAMLGERDRALSLTEKAVKRAPHDPKVAHQAAVTYEQVGRRDSALKWIEKALNRGYPRSAMKRQRGLRELRTDPRFQQILQGSKVPS